MVPVRSHSILSREPGAGARSIELYVGLTMCLWLESLLFCSPIVFLTTSNSQALRKVLYFGHQVPAVGTIRKHNLCVIFTEFSV